VAEVVQDPAATLKAPADSVVEVKEIPTTQQALQAVLPQAVVVVAVVAAVQILTVE
jgi:hypothetical protein